jgi:hypothetical protein
MRNKHRSWKSSDRIFLPPVKRNFKVTVPHWAKPTQKSQQPQPTERKERDAAKR